MTGPVSDWLAGTTVGPQPTPEDNVVPFKKSSPVQDWLEGPDHTTAIEQSLSASPDEEAKKRKLSEQSGLPYDAVDADPAEVQRLVRKQQIDNLVKDAPLTREWLSDPLNASVAHDDVESLTAIESIWGITKKLGEATTDTVRALGAGALYVPRGINALAWGIEETLGLEDAAANAAAVDKNLADLQAMVLGEQEGLHPLVSQGIQSAGQGLALLMTRNPGAAIRGAGITTAGLEATKGREEGLSPGKALFFGGMQGVAEMVTEKIPIEKLFKSLKVGDGLFKTLGQQLLIENVTEQVATAWQDLNEWLFIHPEKSIGEYLEERPNAALETAIATTVGTVFQTSIAHTSSRLAQRMKGAEDAKKFGEKLNKTQETLANSALTPRDPAAAINHFSKVGPKTTYLSVDGITELANKLELSPVDLAQQLGIRPQFEKEYLRGGDIQLSAEQLGQLMLNEEWSLLSEHIRETEDSFTLREAEEFEKTGLKEEIESALKPRAEGILAYHGSNAVFDKFDMQFIKTGEGNLGFGYGMHFAQASEDAETYRNAQGNIYEVNIQLKKDDFLDFDQPLDYQSDKVVNALKEVANKIKLQNPNSEFANRVLNNTGELASQLYMGLARELGQVTGNIDEYGMDEKAASDLLKEAGISGNIYYDVKTEEGRKSRANFVVFEPDSVVVLKRNGVPITQAEIDVTAIEKDIATDGIFQTSEEAGMTATEYMFYLASLDKAHKAAVNRQNEKLLKDAQRKVSKEYKKLRKDMREGVRESLTNSPVYQAINSIQKDRLDRAAVAAILGDEKYLDQLPKQSKGRPIYTNKGEEGGIDPSVVAEIHGFDTASDMLLAMMTALPFDQAVEQATDQMMQRQYPDLTNEKLRLDAALESLHNDATSEVLVQELNRLRELAAEKKAKKAEKPTKEAKEKKPQTEAQKKAIEVRKIKLNVLKNAIKKQLESTPIKDVRVGRFVKTAKEQGKLAGKLLRKGDVEGAIDAKFKQLTNFIMAQQAYKVKAETEKQNKKLNQLATRKRNKLPQSYYDMIRQKLSDYNIGPKLSEKTRKRMQDWVARKTAEGAIFQIPPQLLSDQKKYWQDMTIAEWRDLVDAVKNIEAQGRLQKQSTALHGKVEFEHERAVLLKQAENIPDTARAKRAEKSAVKTYKDKIAAGIAAFDAAIVKMENLLRELDGETVGPWWEAFYKRFSRAETEKLDMMEKHVRPIIQDAFKQLPKKVLSRMNKKVFVPSLGKEYTYSQLLKIALNMGNPSNISKMLDGHNEHERGKTWTQQDLIDAMALLSPEEARWVQGVWDQLESFRPAVERVYEAEMGIAAERIPIQPVVIGGVKVKGGYFPMQYAQTPTFSTPLEAMQDPLIRAGIFSGMTKERTKFSAPIDLDLNGMINALEQQIHFITHYEAVRNVNKLLNDKDITRIIRDKLGEEYLNEFKSWYSAVASGGMQRGANDPIDIGTEIFRTNMTAAALGGNLITIGSQVLGAFSSISQMAKPIKGDKGYSSWRGMSAFAKGGWIYATKKNAVKDATALSGVIRHRIASQDRDMRENMNKLKGKTDLKSRWNRMMMLTISGMQLYSVDIPTWIGAYNLGLKDGLSVEKAIDYADNILTTSQGSGHIKDLSALQRERGLKRALTMFSTWTFIQYNLQRDIVKSAKKFPVDAFAKSVWITLAPAVLAAWMRGNFGPDDEEDETWAGWLAQVFLGYNLGSVPVVGQWIGAVSQGYDFSFTPIQRIPDSLEKMLESVSKIFDEDEELDYKDISNIVKGTGYTLGIGGTTTAGRMFDALNKAEEEDVDWWEYITGPSRK